eukprot:349889-Chlamydomonas_euryale.AAC.1
MGGSHTAVMPTAASSATCDASPEPAAPALGGRGTGHTSLTDGCASTSGARVGGASASAGGGGGGAMTAGESSSISGATSRRVAMSAWQGRQRQHPSVCERAGMLRTVAVTYERAARAMQKGVRTGRQAAHMRAWAACGTRACVGGSGTRACVRACVRTFKSMRSSCKIGWMDG